MIQKKAVPAVDASKPTQSKNKVLANLSQDNTAKDAHQKLYRQVIAVSLVIQALLIGVRGNIRILSGDPLLDVIPSMLVQGTKLIMEAAKDSERKSRSDD